MGQRKTKCVLLRCSAFRSWLLSHSSDSVGHGVCPITQWLEDVYCYDYARVTCENYYYFVGNKIVYCTIPLWVKAFDKVLDRYRDYSFRDITGVEALTVLDETERIIVSDGFNFESWSTLCAQERYSRLSVRHCEEREVSLGARLDKYNMSLGCVVLPDKTVYMIIGRSSNFVLKRNLTLYQVTSYVCWLEEHSFKEGNR